MHVRVLIRVSLTACREADFMGVHLAVSRLSRRGMICERASSKPLLNGNKHAWVRDDYRTIKVRESLALVTVLQCLSAWLPDIARYSYTSITDHCLLWGLQFFVWLCAFRLVQTGSRTDSDLCISCRGSVRRFTAVWHAHWRRQKEARYAYTMLKNKKQNPSQSCFFCCPDVILMIRHVVSLYLWSGHFDVNFNRSVKFLILYSATFSTSDWITTQ